MKKTFLLAVVVFLFSTVFTMAQNMGVGGSFSPSSIPVGQTSTLEIQAGAGLGSYAPGEIILTISVPPQFFDAPNPPIGTSYTWTSPSAGTWSGTNIVTISTIETITLVVVGTGVTTAGAQAAVINISPQFAIDQVSSDNDSRPILLVTAAPSSSVNCTTNTLSPNTYTINGTSQTGTYTVGVSNLVAGATYTVNVSGTNFVSNPNPYTFVATSGQTSVAIPVTYNGGGTAGSETITATISAADATSLGSCNTTATLSVPANLVITPSNTSPTVGSPVTLSTSGCAGTVTWNPGGQTGNSITVTATNPGTQYTATCSTGGTGTYTVTGAAPACSANAGTLN